MREVEVKMELLAAGAFRQRLAALGVEPTGPVTQRDTFFRHPQRDLAATDEALRLRQEGERSILTYKGPRTGTGTKVRKEVEVELTGDALPLLEALGFTATVVLEKTRTTWHIGAVEVSIDELDGLGAFVEVEAVDGSAPDAEATVEGAIEKLGLVGAPRHTMSYLEMALETGAPAAQRL